MSEPWGLGLRISDDKADGAGVDRQEVDGRAAVKQRGGHVAEVYRENDVSAYKRRMIVLPDGSRARRVVRPDFRRSLDDLQAGRVVGVMWYDLDRLTREPRDLEDAIDVVEDTGRPIAAVTGSIDLSTDHGITMARMLVAVANKSSRDTSRRVSRAKLALAESGRPAGGRRPYGYTADHLHIVPAEAGVIREVARRRLTGEGWTSLAKDLNTRGIPTATGARWTWASLRYAASKPSVAGIRTLRGREVSTAVWPAILDRATWEQLRALTRPHEEPPVRAYLLSGLARCGLCGAGLGASSKDGIRLYRCKDIDCGRISRVMHALDTHVVDVALGLLAGLDLTAIAPPSDPAAAAELGRLGNRRAAVVAAFADVDGDDPLELRQTLADLDDRIGQLERRTDGGRRARLLRTVQGISRERWEELPLDTRRAVLADLVTVRVNRARPGRGPFDTASVDVAPVWSPPSSL